MKKLVALFLLSCGVASAAPGDAALIAKSKTMMADRFADPDSAKFRKVFVIKGTVCGEVNAKNLMGGYVGYRRFVVDEGDALVDSGSSTFDDLWEVACSKNPPKPLSPTRATEARLRE